MTREAIGVDVVMDTIFSPNRSKSKKTSLRLLCQMRDINCLSGECLVSKEAQLITINLTQFGLSDKGRAIIVFVVCNS